MAERDVYPENLVKLVIQARPHSYQKNNITYTAGGPVDLGANGFKSYDTAARATAGRRLARALEKVTGH